MGRRDIHSVYSHLIATADMYSGGRGRCGGGSFQQVGSAFPSHYDGGQHGGGRADCSSDFAFNRFLSKGDISGFEAVEKNDGDAFFQPITFWSGLKKLQVGGIAQKVKPSSICINLNLLDMLQEDDLFRERFVQLLRNSEFDSYFFEMPGVSSDTAYINPFRFVLVKAPGLLGRAAEQRSFQEHFARCEIVFPSI